MFSTRERLKRRTGKNKVDRPAFLKLLVEEFKTSKSQEAKEQVLANLGNFSYDPINYGWLRNLSVIQLFLEELASSNEKIVEYSVGGLCNLCLDFENKEIILGTAGSLSAIKNCLTSSNQEIVTSTIALLIYLVTPKSKPGTQTVTLERRITRGDVDTFAELSGDTNPVHFTGEPIVHGALLNSFLSGVIGTILPGPGTILVSQNFKFPNPCRVGDAIVIRVSVNEMRKITVCKYDITRKADGKCLMEGSARVILPKQFASD